jgi:hypothetical protein
MAVPSVGSIWGKIAESLSDKSMEVSPRFKLNFGSEDNRVVFGCESVLD